MVLAFLLHLEIERGQIELHLANKFRLKLPHLEFNGDQTPQTPMEKQKIDEELPAIYLQPVLAADEGNKTTHGPKKVFDAADQRSLQFPFGMLLAELEKVKGVLIPNGQLCLRTQLGCQSLVEIRLAEQSLLITLIFDLMNEDALGPSELFRHADVELSFEDVLAFAEDNQMLGPTDFSNQRLEFFVAVISEIKLPHIPEVLRRKPLDTRKLGAQVGCQPLHDRLAPTGPISLTFADNPSKVPIECY